MQMVRVATTTVLVGILLTGHLALAQEESGVPALAAALEEAFVQAIERAEDSVVSIMRINLGPNSSMAQLPRFPPNALRSNDPSHPEFIPNAMGAGVVVDPSGLVLTNYHVVRETTTDPDEIKKSLLYVTVPGGIGFYASIWAADPTSDLAVLRLEPREGQPVPDLKPIRMGDGSSLKKGQLVLALGNPYNIARDGSPSVSWGIVSNIARKSWPGPVRPETRREPRDLHRFGTLLQTDARLNLGTSGGALVNLRGEMIGLTTSLAAIAGYEQSAGYAIPMTAPILRIIETLKGGREVEYGFLGVDVGRRQANLAQPAAGSQGVLIKDVWPGTPAHRAGLLPGDRIVSLGGETVNERDDLFLAAATQLLGKPTSMVVLRNNRSVEVNVELTKFPVEPGVIASVQPEPWRGIRIDHPTAREDVFKNTSGSPALQQALQQGCVLVTSVLPGSPAANAGVEEEDLITHVNGKRVRTPAEFYEAVKGLRGTIDLRLAKVSKSDESIVRIPPK